MRTLIVAFLITPPVVMSFDLIGGEWSEPRGLLKFLILGLAFGIVDATHDWRKDGWPWVRAGR